MIAQSKGNGVFTDPAAIDTILGRVIGFGTAIYAFQPTL
ncbi:hypothetical protein OKW21_006125 [Catalinimonas alkaloidigena]|nr:hypothetical protein [Catalinimonas alkaloidigena]